MSPGLNLPLNFDHRAEFYIHKDRINQMRMDLQNLHSRALERIQKAERECDAIIEQTRQVRRELYEMKEKSNKLLHTMVNRKTEMISTTRHIFECMKSNPIVALLPEFVSELTLSSVEDCPEQGDMRHA